jgi:hypothetical protein
MTSHSGPIYEVTVFVAPDAAADCEQRLAAYAERMASNAAIIDCTVFAAGEDSQGRLRRVCLLSLTGDDVLDDLIDGPCSDFEAQLETHFGDQVELHARVLREDQTLDLSPEASPDCPNCNARLRGQYCGNCGQRSRNRLISLWELISDGFGDLLEIDSRLWQTLIPMMFRPGRLTSDYLQGRRARYMPPFRMYLVLSVLFFVVAFFDPRESLSLLYEPLPEATVEEVTEDAVSQQQEILDELEIDDDGFNVTFDGEEWDAENECDVDASDLEDFPPWLARRLTVERLQRVCERTQIDGGEAFLDNLLDNIPAALIVLLPLMAFVLKALYPLSKRYYVEHLLFFVHFHAFFFLMLSFQILWMRLAAWLQVPEALAILIVVVAAFYVPVYLFVSMRRVYGQGRIITFLKYLVLLTSYILGFAATMLGAVAIAAFSV